MDQTDEGVNRPALKAVFAIGVANFAAFMIVSVCLGGDAVNGKVVDGRYFLRNHSAYAEVSEVVFNYSLWHVRSLFVTHPLAGLAAWILQKTKPAGSYGVHTSLTSRPRQILGLIDRDAGWTWK